MGASVYCTLSVLDQVIIYMGAKFRDMAKKPFHGTLKNRYNPSGAVEKNTISQDSAYAIRVKLQCQSADDSAVGASSV